MSGIVVVGEPKESLSDYVRSAFSSLYSSLYSLVVPRQQTPVDPVVAYKRFDEDSAERDIAKRCDDAVRRYSLDTALYRAGKAPCEPEPIDCLDVDLKHGDPKKIFAPFGLEFIADNAGPAPLCETYIGPRTQIDQIERKIQERLMAYGGRAIIGKSSLAPETSGIISRLQLWPPQHHYVYPTKDDKPKSETL